MSEIRHALRTLLNRPGPTAVVVLTLAVALAATTVIYSVIDLVWHLNPAINQDGLLYVASTDTRVLRQGASGRSVVFQSRVSAPDLADWTARSSTFDELAGFDIVSANLTGLDVPMRVTAIRVTANLPALWGFTPILGRSFRPEEGQTGADPVTLLSHQFWQRQFSGDRAVVGRSLRLDGVAHTVVGVLPREAGTGFFVDAEVFMPLVLDPLRGPRDSRRVLVTGRLNPGVTRQQATADLETIASQLRAEHPDTNRTIGAVVLPLIEATGMNVRVLLSILGLVGLLVLVVACANVAGVVVAQYMGRRHELAVRAALGASLLDRVRQLMIESTLASVAAGVLGLVLATWAIAGLRWLASGTFGFAEVAMNGRVLAAGMLTALALPAGFGLIPALRIAAHDAQELRDATGVAGVPLRGRRTRSLIVALQAGAAMILMLLIGLLVRTTWRLSDVSPGLDPAQVLTFHIGLPASRYDPPAIRRFTSELLSRIGGLPGVSSAGIIDRLPIYDREPIARLTVEGDAPAPLDARPSVARSAIAGSFLETMRIPITAGRGFSDAEAADGSAVALVNEEAARRFWPGGDPLGRRIALDALPGREVWLEVVGVVGNLRNSDVDQGPLPQVFIPLFRQPGADMAVVVKSDGADPLELVPAMRALVAGIDPNQPIHDVASMSQVLYDDLAGTYVLTALLTVIGFVALCLSAAGIYGVVAYAVSRRRREIGVRMALGAQPASVVRMVVGHGARPVAAGSLVGLAAAMALAFGFAAAVPELDPRDPISYGGVLMIIGLVALVASYLPARRAARIDPVAALRME
jgi:predicted permease